MSYTIFVRDILTQTTACRYMLACEISERKKAEEMIARLADTYEEHGLDRGTSVHWFRDRQGLHEIWVQRMAEPASAPKPFRLPQEAHRARACRHLSQSRAAARHRTPMKLGAVFS